MHPSRGRSQPLPIKLVTCVLLGGTARFESLVAGAHAELRREGGGRRYGRGFQVHGPCHGATSGAVPACVPRPDAATAWPRTETGAATAWPAC